MSDDIDKALQAVTSARFALYEASQERRRLSLAPMRKPILIEAANIRVIEAREGLDKARSVARKRMFGE